MKKVVVVDDHPVVRLAIGMLLQREGYTVVAETDNGIEAVRLARELQPELMILDIGLPKLDGLGVIASLNQYELPIKVLVLTTQPANLYSMRCMQAGAVGYVSKNEDLSDLIAALKAIGAGYTYFPNLSFSSVHKGDIQADEHTRLNLLSNREMAVLRLLAVGRSNKEIGDEMALSNKTISTYKVRIMEKLQVQTLVDLVDIAKRHTLV
ncbi:LuxR family transcriptional regulator [Chania multitudinisentens RB-25]|uniref:LuxR family transcriptional regulator n=1 Tax=Chania multitudinisentens RB-25 TaxID=1441930 RepID=W0LF45_9GAMM|nr:response regulator transcription factor [Chania multitudinisentens]AHG21014.1 LuxR family transcriptional regulator [Chania multitudinisentens RB-25]